MSINLCSQKLIEASYLESINQATFQFFFNTFTDQITARSGVDLYRVKYHTIGSDGAADIASGLLCIPNNIGGTLPLAIYQHGTTNGRSEVPSNLSGQEYLLAAGLGTVGFIGLAPDYIGMGESRGFHPYVHAETEARAAIDLLEAVKEYLNDNELAFSDQLFVTGYSQGGHAALATHKYMQEQDIDVTASLPMSGPYNMAGVMRDVLLTDDEFYYPSYLVYTTLGMKAIDDDLYNDLSEVFKPEFLPYIEEFAATGEGLNDLNRNLLTILESDFGGSVPKRMFVDSTLSLIENDPNHQINVMLRASDVTHWVPESPVLMLYCEADEQVPYRNSVIADSVMNALDAINVSSQDVSGGIDRTHSQCIAPALTIGVPWLLSFIETTPTVEIISDNLKIYPNPTSDDIHISLADVNVRDILLYSIDGQLVSRSTHDNIMSLSHINDGLYIISIHTDQGIITEKIVIQH